MAAPPSPIAPAASANGHLLIGENWDWIPEVRGALVHTDRARTAFRLLGFTEAGIFGAKIGLNAAGLGLLINGMATTDDDWSRLSLPFHARCRAILRVPHARRGGRRSSPPAPRACAANFLLAQTPDRIVDIEAAPDRVAALGRRGRAASATPTTSSIRARLGVVEPEIERGPDSQDRLAGCAPSSAPPRPLALADLAAALRDQRRAHPDAICRHPDLTQPPEERYATVVSVIMDLHAQTLWISDGPPDQVPYTRIALAELGSTVSPAPAESPLRRVVGGIVGAPLRPHRGEQGGERGMGHGQFCRRRRPVEVAARGDLRRIEPVVVVRLRGCGRIGADRTQARQRFRLPAGRMANDLTRGPVAASTGHLPPMWRQCDRCGAKRRISGSMVHTRGGECTDRRQRFHHIHHLS